MNPNISGNIQLKESIKTSIESSRETDAMIQQNKSAAVAKLADDVDENSVAGMLAKTKKLIPEKKTKSKAVEKTEKGVLVRKEMDNLADGFSQREGNKEYRLPPSGLSKLALSLGDSITPDIDPEDLMRMVRNGLIEGGKNPDVSQVDKAFEFLLEVTQLKMDSAKGLEATFLEKLFQHIAATKVKHYEIFKAEIEAAHNIIGAANVLVTENRSTAEALDHLREMINNPQDVHTKFKFYKAKSYNHKMLMAEFKLLFNYMGSLVKKRLENPHLKQLLEEIKVLQSILGVFRQGKREFSSMFVHLDKAIGIFGFTRRTDDEEDRPGKRWEEELEYSREQEEEEEEERKKQKKKKQ